MRKRHVVTAAAAVCVITALAPGLFADDAPEAAPSPFKNVKVRTDVTSKAEMRRIMKEQARALGVKCTHCHVPGKFELDDKKEKVTGRAMMKMVDELNAKYFPKAAEPPVSCWTCHRGEKKPAAPPPPLPAAADSFEADE